MSKNKKKTPIEFIVPIKEEPTFDLILSTAGAFIGKTHKDILESLFGFEKILIKEDNSLAVNFTKSSLLFSIGNVTENDKWLEERIKELRDFSFETSHPNAESGRIREGGFHIIDQYRFEEDKSMSIKFTQYFTDLYRDQ